MTRAHRPVPAATAAVLATVFGAAAYSSCSGARGEVELTTLNQSAQVATRTTGTSTFTGLDKTRAASAAGRLLDRPTRIEMVKGAGVDVLRNLYPGEKVFGDSQTRIGAQKLLVVRVPAPTRNIVYPTPPGVAPRPVLSALLVLDESGQVIASQLAVVDAGRRDQISRMTRMGSVQSLPVTPAG